MNVVMIRKRSLVPENEQMKMLTCHMEEDDACVFSSFVGSSTSVEGMGLSLLNLQRADDFLVNTHLLC